MIKASFAPSAEGERARGLALGAREERQSGALVGTC